MKDLLKRMSLKQKAGQLNQKLYGWECYKKVEGDIELSSKLKKHIDEFDGIGAIYGLFRADPWSNVDFENGLSYEQSIQLINQIRKYINDNCSIPLMPLIVEEMPHGHQGLNANCYPVNIAIGATFNPDLYEQAIKEQLRYANSLGINVGLISGLDIARDTRWGRTEETFGSDPKLSSQFVEKIALNFKNDKTVACLKHFAAQGAPYMGLNSGAVNIGEREFREIHLPPTKLAAKTGFDLIMAAYNEIDGIPCHANKKLLTSILREELGFSGTVMADGTALDRLVNENTSYEQAAALAIDAGVGLSLWDDAFTKLDKAVELGVLNQELLDLRVLEMLELKQKLGLVNYSELEADPIEINDDLNYKLAVESVILQKNDAKYLPLNNNQSCLFIGDTFDSLYTFLGDYTAFQDITKYLDLKQLIEMNLEHAKCITIAEAIELEAKQLNQFDRIIVIGGGTSSRDFGMEFEANGALRFGDGITDSGENIDLGKISLKQKQYDICRYLDDLDISYGFVCVQGRPYALKSIALNAKAIVSSYYNGQQGPKAILNILLGKENPSGKNPVSMPHHAEYFGFEYNSKQDMRNEKYVDQSGEMFEFGHGLNYSQLEYIDAKLENDYVTVEIKNNSDIDCDEIVQVYVKKTNSIIVKRRRELVEFNKISIPANEIVTVKFKIDNSWLETIGLNMETVIEKGNYKLIIGTGIKTYFELDYIV